MATIDTDWLEDIAREALTSGEEEAALAQILPAAESTASPRLWQFAGLLERSLDRHPEALRAYTEAARLSPDDAGIAHSLAQVALEAGVDAVPLFERALRLDPSNGNSVLGFVAAKLATGRGVEAEAQLDSILDRSPFWVVGHRQLAQLRSMLGKSNQYAASLERVLASHPQEEGLWAALLNLALSKEDFAALGEMAARARLAMVSDAVTVPFEVIAASEQGDLDSADRLYAAMTPELRDTIPLWHVRHLLRKGRVGEAIGLIDRELEGPRAMQLWPYAATAWRLAGDPRWDWLEAEGKLISTFDLRDRLPPLGQLADVLRSLHVSPGEYLDQSVRGGTQTDGPLLSRIEPEIQAMRAAIVAAVEEYRRQLPPPEPRHPLLGERRDRLVRFSGSWSVRLRGLGYHANHVHPQGWISSALYVALPDRAQSDLVNAGWLKLGEPPPELGLDLPPVRLIEPKPGRLVLFPSWMWHGTVPFGEGERLTVAFDVRPPI